VIIPRQRLPGEPLPGAKSANRMLSITSLIRRVKGVNTMANTYPEQVPFDCSSYPVEGYSQTERVKTLRNSLPVDLQE
jgi:hypothetical protein